MGETALFLWNTQLKLPEKEVRSQNILASQSIGQASPSMNYPKLTEEILECAPTWDESKPATAQLRDIAVRLGLTIREYLLWHKVHEARQRDRRMWTKTMPPLLREWFKAVTAEMERQGFPSEKPRRENLPDFIFPATSKEDFDPNRRRD